MPPYLRRWPGLGPASCLLVALHVAAPPLVGADVSLQPATAEGAVRSAEKLSGPATPTGKVIELLKGLATKITDAGKDEAASYDKFACFCKEQADGKLYAIDKSNKTIEGQTARIEELDTEINDLVTAISGLSAKVTEKEEAISKLEEERAAAHAVYKGKAADAESAISAVGRAIDALKESKAGSTGGASLLATTALAQVRETVLRTSLVSLSAAQAAVLGSHTGGQQPKSYGYHSNDIIETLEGLQDTFKKQKADLDTEEFSSNSEFEKVRLGLQNEAKFAGMEKEQKEKLEGKASEEKNSVAEAKAEETKGMKADNAFLDVLTGECEEKAGFWDQRSQTRSAELTAIQTAIEALESGVVPNAGANKKLTGLQVRQSVNKSAVALKAPSFLQLRGSTSGWAAAPQRAKMLNLLDAASTRLSSSALALVALQVRATKEDHFVKVRSIINDLIEKLEAEALAEENEKGYCDEHLKKAVEARDEASSDKEAFAKSIDEKEAEADMLEKKIAELSQEIADSKKALLEATELRGEEQAENEKVISDATAGKEAVSTAIKVLTDFYEGAAGLLQRGRAGFVPANSDRTGATVADLAPEVFDSEYKGEQGESKGIIGMLQVIHDDFDRTITSTGDEEKGAQSEFEEFQEDTETDADAKKDEVEQKKSDIVTLKEELVELKEDISEAKKEHESQLTELERLREMCTEGAESYEDRSEKRTQEVEALKEALAILENWKGL